MEGPRHSIQLPIFPEKISFLFLSACLSLLMHSYIHQMQLLTITWAEEQLKRITDSLRIEVYVRTREEVICDPSAVLPGVTTTTPLYVLLLQTDTKGKKKHIKGVHHDPFELGVVAMMNYTRRESTPWRFTPFFLVFFYYFHGLCLVRMRGNRHCLMSFPNRDVVLSG